MRDLFRPDVLCVQELETEIRGVSDEALSGHARVDDPFPGWATRSNIWWNRSLVDLVAYGAEEVGISREPDRRLFWVRLKVADRDRSAFVLDSIVANAHALAVSAASPHVYAGDIPPSDHWPVQAVYELS